MDSDYNHSGNTNYESLTQSTFDKSLKPRYNEFNNGRHENDNPVGGLIQNQNLVCGLKK